MLYDNTGSSVGWGDAAVLLPYRYWKRYGDNDFLADSIQLCADTPNI